MTFASSYNLDFVDTLPSQVQSPFHFVKTLAMPTTDANSG